MGVDIREREKSRLDEMAGGKKATKEWWPMLRTLLIPHWRICFAWPRSGGRSPSSSFWTASKDPHNLGAIIRSAVAMGAHGVVIPKNRSAEVNGGL